MKGSTWKRIVRPQLDGSWAFRGKLAYKVPTTRVLRGLLAEDSDSGGIYLWRVVMPLCPATNHLWLTFSARIGGGTARYIDDDQHRDHLLAAISEGASRLPNEEDAILAIADTVPAGNPIVNEAIGYCQLLLGRSASALSLLTQPLHAAI